MVSKRRPGQIIPEQCVLPRPSKEQLEGAVRKAQQQLHAQGLSVTLGSLDCALAQAFGLTGSLSDLGYQPRDLTPIQVHTCAHVMMPFSTSASILECTVVSSLIMPL